VTDIGFLYPKKGIHRYFHDQPETETPLRETRFEVTECRINEPDFDEEIFKIALHPDTAVSDLRYGVNYRTGVENTYTTQLAALSEAALAEASLEQARIDAAMAAAPLPVARNMSILLWINFAIVVGIIAVVAGRRLMKK
jgi:hypothetical protein